MAGYQHMKVKIIFNLLFILSFNLVFPQDEVIDLWDNNIPGSIASKSYKEEFRKDAAGNVTGLSKVSVPTLSIFLPENANGTAVVILPGGGYGHLAIDKEGYKVAKWFNSLGVTAFVLKYRLPSNEIMKDKSLAPLADAQMAVRKVREKASKWNLDLTKIGILGFSAGGHLAATISNRFDEKISSEKGDVHARPDFSILIYPVISMFKDITHEGSRANLLGEKPTEAAVNNFSMEKMVRQTTPPTFLVHATDDATVPVENTLRYYQALKDNKVPVELHIYEKGGHGFGMGREGTSVNWPASLEQWLQQNGFVDKAEALLFSYFKGNGEDGLHLAYSEDGLTWKSLKNDHSFLKPELGNEKLMRDPNIINGGDGKYHMVWTVGWTEKGIGYANSIDLINWSPQQFLPVMEHEKEARNTWAPEITYDPDNDEYMIYWATTIRGKFPETQVKADDGYNHRMYYTTTKDFQSFSPTKLLYEPGFNSIDANIIKDGKKFVMFLKDETRDPAQKNLKVAMSNDLRGPYTPASPPITEDYWAEGPTAIKKDGEWWVYFDKYIEKEYGAVISKDLMNWEDVSSQVKFPEGTRHGSIIKVSAKILNSLKNL